MYRYLIQTSARACKQYITNCRINPSNSAPVLSRLYSEVKESDDDFDARYVQYFNQPNIDGWMVRKGMNDLRNFDLIPDPQIIIAALHACRRINEFALTIRLLESVKDSCGQHVAEVWPYLMQEVGPTMKELGIPTLEELSYDKAEKYLPKVWDI